MLNDITRCLGRDCHQRQHCARYTAPVPENVSLSWASNLNPERAHLCAYFIPETRMTEQIPTPTPEQVQQWINSFQKGPGKPMTTEDFFLAAQAAEWAVNQELEACCAWLKAKEWIHPEFSDELRAARRPKPKSLAEEALEALNVEDDARPVRSWEEGERLDTIRRALERLQELEGQGDG